MQKKLSLNIVLILAINLLAGATAVWAQERSSTDGVWKQIDESAVYRKSVAQRQIVPRFYSTFRLDQTAMKGVLNRAPKEFSEAARNGEGVVFSIPMPSGSLSRFKVVNSTIMEPELAAKYPEIQSYAGQGIDNPTETVRFDFSPNGFRAMIFSNQGTIFIEPYAWGDKLNYMSFYKSDVLRSEASNQWYCETEGGMITTKPEEINFLGNAAVAPEVTSGATLRTYRLAMAATGEYTSVFRQAGDTDAQAKTRALAAINTSVNRVNQLYQRDVAVKMVLIANTDLLIYTDGTTDPYENNDGSTMLGQNQTNIDTVIGTGNYDVGHVFSTGGGGVAQLNGPCVASRKAQGVTGLPNPVGDAFDIDFVAHEMGHQFGANHTFNTSCGGNRSGGSAYEPGSGVTIMGYAGVCGAQNLAPHSIDTFHVKSIEVIVAFTTSGSGNNCAVQSATNNTPPTVSAVGGTSWNIPKQTPFVLTATGTDANNDSLTYDWQEYDLGASTSAIPNTDSDGTARPIFRPYLPNTTGVTYFPSLQYILSNANVPPSSQFGFLTGELLPAITRTMNFQVIARDNRLNGGGVNTATVQVMVDGNSGPFNVTAPNTNVNWTGNTTQTVTWAVANTSAAPVSAANVKISLSTDGGQTFPTTILASTPNDGTETITVPNVNTTQARIKVEAVNNIFFDVSDNNFTIVQGTAVNDAIYDYDGDGKTDLSVFRPSDTVWYLLRSQAGFTATQFGASGDRLVAADYDGDNKADIAVFRPSNGTWYRLNSTNGAFIVTQFGANGDIPQPADFDGDGKDDLTLFRPSVGDWFRLNSTNGQFVGLHFGATGDKPVAAEYDGDGKADIAVFRPSNGTWYRINSSNGQLFQAQFGISTDMPVPADFNGDGKDDLAVFRSSNGTWYVARTTGTPAQNFDSYQFGANGDVPVPGDYDGDGKDDVAVYRNGTWFLNRSTAGFAAPNFGLASDQPVNGR